MKNHKTVQALEELLANTYVLLIKTQNYHWNVEGPNFKSLHELFEIQYNDLFASVDEIAERVRALGTKVDASFENFSKLSKIKKGEKSLDASAMISDLVASNDVIVKSLEAGIKTAQDEGDEGTADLFIQRLKVHEKAIWMLQSSK